MTHLSAPAANEMQGPYPGPAIREGEVLNEPAAGKSETGQAENHKRQ